MKTKQCPIVPSIRDKDFIQSLKDEFELKNDAEAIEIIIEVASTMRFDGDEDRFEFQANRIKNARAGRKTEAKIDRLQKLIAELEAAKAAKVGA